MLTRLSLPENQQSQSEITLLSNSIIVIGANGSGKTRLGTWLEFNSPYTDKVHRISAQKSLTMPDTSTPTAIDLAETDLLYGNALYGKGNKKSYRWNSKPAVSLLNDFEKLMAYLFSEHTEVSAKYLAQSKTTDVKVTPPETKLDKIKKVWEMILPHRELLIGGLNIQTINRDNQDNIYNSSEMSDGERVIFYLIGECVSAPKDGIIIIDEPELHLHKSIQLTLWNRIEDLRSDCLFIYLTHDIHFASAKSISTKIWLKSYNGQKWDWDIIKLDTELPEGLLLEVLGSRKHVVFVEGDDGSYDTALYTGILTNYLVIPRGSCIQVIQAVKAFKNNEQLHHLDVYGIIDRDRRVQAEIEALEKDNIYALKVAEIENLFCTKEILNLVCTRLSRNFDDDFKLIKETVFTQLTSEIENQISLRVASEVKFLLSSFDERKKGARAITDEVGRVNSLIDIPSLWDQASTIFEQVIKTKNYEELLSLYNRKSISSQISPILGLRNGGLPAFVVRLVQGDSKDEVKRCLKDYFGNFSRYIV